MSYVSSVATATAGKAIFNVDIMPQFAGTHSVLVSVRGTSATVPTGYVGYTAGDVATTYSFATGSAPTTATLAAVTGASPTCTDSTTGRLMSVTLNSGAVLGAGETITLTTNNSTAAIGVVNQANGTTGSYTATNTLASTDFVGGVAYFKLRDTSAAATTTVVTATGSGLLSASVTSTISSTTVLLAAAASISVNNGVAAVRPGSGHVGGTAGASFTDTAATTATSHTYGLSTATATAAVTRMVVTDTDGAITGVEGVTYETYVSTAVTTGLGTVSFAATLADGGAFSAVIH